MPNCVRNNTNHMSNCNCRMRTTSHCIGWLKQAGKDTWLALSSSNVNVLLVFVPLGIIAGIVKGNPTTVFVLNLIALVPLIALLRFTTKQLSAKLGRTTGGLLSAVFGKTTQLMIGFTALKQGRIHIVQASMLGSILSSTLVGVGCCFLAGAIHRQEQVFNHSTARLMVVAFILFVITIMPHTASSNYSHIVSLILLALYILYLLFSLKPPVHLPDEEQQPDNEGGECGSRPQDVNATLDLVPAGIALVVTAVNIAYCAEYLVRSIDSIEQTVHVSETFMGLILLPNIGTMAEHVAACTLAYESKMDSAIDIAFSSGMQIAFLTTPLLVILGRIIGQDITLQFGIFETVVLFLSVWVLKFILQDKKSNYLEGAICLGLYIIIALASILYPD